MLSCALEGWFLPVHLDLGFSKLPFLNEQALVPPLHHLASVGVCACLLCAGPWWPRVVEATATTSVERSWFSKTTKAENKLALTVAFIISKRIIRSYVCQDRLCMEPMSWACGDQKTDQMLSFLHSHPQPLPLTSQLLSPREVEKDV